MNHSPARCCYLTICVCLLSAALFGGCGSESEPEGAQRTHTPSLAATGGNKTSESAAKSAPAESEVRAPKPSNAANTENHANAGDNGEAPRSLGDLLQQEDNAPADPEAFGGANFGHPKHDDAKLAAAGIRKIEGRHLTVYTDLPRGDMDGYPRVFDLAVPQWRDYFGIRREDMDKWRMTAYVIKNKQLFQQQGLLYDRLPPFQHGWQEGFELWVYDQPSDYYRRHLLLHEGTHGVMHTQLGGAGPPWYKEGMAELLATHRWDGQRLTLNYNPRGSDEVPFWGRVKIIQDDVAGGKALRLATVMNYDNRAHQNVNAYAWCWAACVFLDSHPVSQKAFRGMQPHVRLPRADFNRRFYDQLAENWNRLAEEWQLFVDDMQYGSDVARLAVQFADGKPLGPDGATFKLKSDRGWQSSGIRLEAGTAYRIQASGRFTIARDDDGAAWPCEPGGVTLRYYDRRPLGVVLGALRDGDVKPAEATPLASPAEFGRAFKWTPKSSGTLYLRVNDSPAELADNAGELTIRIGKASP